MPEIKKIYRSQKDKILAGVCGGLAQYFEIDPVLCRLLAVAVVIFSGFFPGVIAYLVAMALIPKKPE